MTDNATVYASRVDMATNKASSESFFWCRSQITFSLKEAQRKNHKK
jgi:hypothetical protein